MVVPLRIRGVTSDPIVAETIPELFLVAKENPSKKIQRSVNVLKHQLTLMEGQIIGRVGQRWAVSFLPLLAIILGSLFAIRFPSTPPLSVYAKVFVPTVIALLLVFAGGQMVRDARVVSGFSVMWSGNIGLTLLVLFSWMKLRKT